MFQIYAYMPGFYPVLLLGQALNDTLLLLFLLCEVRINF